MITFNSMVVRIMSKLLILVLCSTIYGESGGHGEYNVDRSKLFQRLYKAFEQNVKKGRSSSDKAYIFPS